MTILFTNNASGTLASAVTSAATSVTVSSGQGAYFPAITSPNYFYVTLVDSSNNLEIVKVTARSGDVLTVTRAQDGTSARAFAGGDKVELRVTAAGMSAKHDTEDFNARSISTNGGLTGGGNLSANRTLSIVDGGVSTAKIADSAVTGAKMETSGVTAGVYGSASAIPAITVDSKGRVTAASTNALDLSTKANTGGANATGTWPISVTGNAATATTASGVAWSNVTGKPTGEPWFGTVNGFQWAGYYMISQNQYSVTFTGSYTGDCVSNCDHISAIRYNLVDNGTDISYSGLRIKTNCDCNCCFATGTHVKLANGQTKPIELVEPGDVVVGMLGDATVAHRYDTTIKNNSLWLINGDITVSGGHLFYVDGTWTCPDISAYPDGKFFRSTQEFIGNDLIDVVHQSLDHEQVRSLRVGDNCGGVCIESIERISADDDFAVHNLIVSTGDSFTIANGFIVDGFHRTSIGV